MSNSNTTQTNRNCLYNFAEDSVKTIDLNHQKNNYPLDHNKKALVEGISQTNLP